MSATSTIGRLYPFLYGWAHGKNLPMRHAYDGIRIAEAFSFFKRERRIDTYVKRIFRRPNSSRDYVVYVAESVLSPSLADIETIIQHNGLWPDETVD